MKRFLFLAIGLLMYVAMDAAPAYDVGAKQSISSVQYVQTEVQPVVVDFRLRIVCRCYRDGHSSLQLQYLLSGYASGDPGASVQDRDACISTMHQVAKNRIQSEYRMVRPA